LGSVLSGKTSLATELKSDPRLFTLIVGTSGMAKKSTANDKASDLFEEALDGAFRCCDGAGSAEGLEEEITSNKYDYRMLLKYDEFKHFINKCKIETSVLLNMVNTLFESNKYSNVTKGKGIRLTNTHLSLLSASTIDTYEQCWDSQMSDIGLNNRLWVVPARGERKFELPPPIPARDKERLKDTLRRIVKSVESGVVYDMEPYARTYYREWYLNLPNTKHATRLDAYALRLMNLLTANDERDFVTLDTATKATKLCDWQYKVRVKFDPITADSTMARMEEKIRKILTVYPDLTAREMKQHTNANRSGLWVFEQSLENLSKCGEVLPVGNGRWKLGKMNDEKEEE
jgi:hypothetical protein